MNNHSCGGNVTAMALIVLLFSGCIRGPVFSTHTKNKPNINDLNGVWTPDKATVKDMAERGGYDTKLQTKLILQDNGNLELQNMPDWWETNYGESQRTLRSYTGTWEIAKSIGYWELVVFYSNIQTSFYLLENNPPYKIGIILGDPDSGHKMIFVKQDGQ